MDPIPITRPLFGPEEIEAVRRTLESGWVVQGPYVREFEGLFCEFTGAAQAVATTSCTTSLHIAVAALGLRPGDEVIVPAFTWVATPNVVEYMGAKPVFCDIDLATFNLDVGQVEALINSRTVGIIPVHLFGLCADMDAVTSLAERHGLWVVEDAACALGGYYKGAHAGILGDIGCFSFHPRKSITTGEGGMITTQRRDLADLARTLRDHGASRSDFSRHGARGGFLLADYEHLGYNYRMTDIQGALGCAQMGRAAEILGRRSQLAAGYDEMLAGLDWLDVPKAPDGYVHGYQAYVCLFRPEPPSMDKVANLNLRRNRLMASLEGAGIATRPGTHAPIATGYYRNKYHLKKEDYPNAWTAECLSLALPLYPQMSEGDQQCVVDRLTGSMSHA